MTPLTPTRWEQHKRGIIAVFAIFFIALVVLTVSLAIQGGSGDVKADPAPLFGDCSDRVKERRTNCGGGGGDAECKQFLYGGCGAQEREESPPVDREWDCRSSGAETVCTFDVTCCRTTTPPVVATTTTPTGSETTRRPAAAPPIAPITKETSRPTEPPSAALATTPPTNPPTGQPRPSLCPTEEPSANPTIPWDALAAAEWVRRGEDLDGEVAGDDSGHAVALSGDGNVLAVGAPYNDGAGIDAGRVRVHAWDALAAEWVRRGEDLDGEVANDWSGNSVALSNDGTVVAIGARYNDGAGIHAGHVRVYVWDALAAKWVQRGEDLDGEAAGDHSGKGVALSGDGNVLAVGAPRNDAAGDNAGRVRVHAWDTLDAKWVRRGEDLDGEAAGDESGILVALSDDGTVLAVGARYNDGAGNNAGHVRVHAWDALAAEWVRRGEDLNGEAGDWSGWPFALSGDGTVVAVGARYNDGAGNNAGRVRVHAWDALAAEWVRRGEDLDGEAAGDQSGGAVALSGDGTVVAIGARYNDSAGIDAGRVRVHAWDAPAAKWVRRGEDLDGEAAGDESGYSVALSSDGTVVAVGAPNNDGAGDGAGHVRVHTWQAVNKA